MVEKLREQAELLDWAKSKLKRWITQCKGAPPPAHMEWKGILERTHRKEIADLKIQDSKNALRLKQSNPLVAVLTPQERWNVLKAHETLST